MPAVSTAADVSPYLASSVPLPFPSLAGQLYPAITSVEYYLRTTVTAIDRLPLWDNRRSPHPELLVTLEQTKALRGAWCAALWDQLGVLWLNSTANYNAYLAKLNRALEERHIAERETICGSQSRASLHPQYAAGGTYLASLENAMDALSVQGMANPELIGIGGSGAGSMVYGSQSNTLVNTSAKSPASRGSAHPLASTLPMGASVPSLVGSPDRSTQSPNSQRSPTNARPPQQYTSAGISPHAGHTSGQNYPLSIAHSAITDPKLLSFAETVTLSFRKPSGPHPHTHTHAKAQASTGMFPEHLERSIVSYLSSRGIAYDPSADVPPLSQTTQQLNFADASSIKGDASTFGNSHPNHNTHDVFVSSMSYATAHIMGSPHNNNNNNNNNNLSVNMAPPSGNSLIHNSNASVSVSAGGIDSHAKTTSEYSTYGDANSSPFATIGKITRLVLRQIYERSVLERTCREHSHLFAAAKAQDRQLLADRLDRFNGLLMQVTDAVERKIASAALPNEDVGAMGMGLGGLVSIGGITGTSPRNDQNSYGGDGGGGTTRSVHGVPGGSVSPRRRGSPTKTTTSSKSPKNHNRRPLHPTAPSGSPTHNGTNANNNNSTTTTGSGQRANSAINTGYGSNHNLNVNRAPFGSATARTLMGSNNGQQQRLSTAIGTTPASARGITDAGTDGKGAGARKNPLPLAGSASSTPPPANINNYINTQQQYTNGPNNNSSNYLEALTSEASITGATSSFFNNTSSNDHGVLVQPNSMHRPSALGSSTMPPHHPSRAQQQSTLPTSGFLTV